MKLTELKELLQSHPSAYPRFYLPDGDQIPSHFHITEVGYVTKRFIDCGGVTGQEAKVVLQAHPGNDTDHRLKSDRFATILQLGNRVLPGTELDVEIEYDCCVVAQYPIGDAKVEGQHLDLILERSRTQCRARGRRETEMAAGCCASSAPCC